MLDEKVNDSLWFENGTGVVMMAHCDAGLFMIPPAIYFFFCVCGLRGGGARRFLKVRSSTDASTQQF